LPLAGKTLGPRAIQDRRVLQGLKGRKVFKELPGRRAKLAPRVRRGHKVLLGTKARRVKKGRRATRATPVSRFVSSKLTGK
jgi:hypothetical protein